MANSVAEAIIGAVVLATAAGFAIYAGQASGMRIGQSDVALTAKFRDANGISVGTDVRVAGIKVGTITGLDLDPTTFQAVTTFTVPNTLEIPDDSGVKVASEGLLGGSFLEVSPGGSDVMLVSGDEITNTQGSVDLLNLLMRFATGSSE